MFRRKAFTLIELLLVIGIIAVLAGIVITAVNPRTQFVTAQNAKRQSAVRELQNAIAQYQIDRGLLPDTKTLPGGAVNAMSICRTAVQSYCYDLSGLVPNYLSALPIDPAEPSSVTTGFGLHQTSGNQVQAVAMHMGVSDAGGPTDYIGRWLLQDNAASTTVAAAVGINGTLTNAGNTAANAVTGPGGIYSRALSFDGTNDYVEIADDAYDFGAQSFSLAFWLSSNALDSSFRALISKRTSTDYTGWTVYRRPNTGLNSNRIAVEIASSNGGPYYTATGDSPISPGQWYQVAVTVNRSSNLMTLYVNGVAQAAVADITALGNVSNSQNVQLAKEIGINTWNGSLADVRIYNRALSATEVAALAAGL
jgi:prepilin-type N-terminal cleavage/methylation domain-containing protein